MRRSWASLQLEHPHKTGCWCTQSTLGGKLHESTLLCMIVRLLHLAHCWVDGICSAYTKEVQVLCASVSEFPHWFYWLLKLLQAQLRMLVVVRSLLLCRCLCACVGKRFVPLCCFWPQGFHVTAEPKKQTAVFLHHTLLFVKTLVYFLFHLLSHTNHECQWAIWFGWLWTQRRREDGVRGTEVIESIEAVN